MHPKGVFSKSRLLLWRSFDELHLSIRLVSIVSLHLRTMESTPTQVLSQGASCQRFLPPAARKVTCFSACLSCVATQKFFATKRRRMTICSFGSVTSCCGVLYDCYQLLRTETQSKSAKLHAPSPMQLYAQAQAWHVCSSKAKAPFVSSLQTLWLASECMQTHNNSHDCVSTHSWLEAVTAALM